MLRPQIWIEELPQELRLHLFGLGILVAVFAGGVRCPLAAVPHAVRCSLRGGFRFCFALSHSAIKSDGAVHAYICNTECSS